ncbi:MAG: lactate utilization protein [Firmicutes bacterium]|nr:lactate utilization protein [Bacillota bacterium]
MVNDFPINQLTKNFAKRNIDVLWFDTFEDVKSYLLQEIPGSASVGIGNSKTLKSMEITKALCTRGNDVFDKTLGNTKEEVRKLKRNALLTDYYISGSNAVSVDGRIINIDHSGNRVAAITFGPDKVYIVIGKNKITATHHEAMKRARDVSAPLNAKRAGFNPPCVLAGHCTDCNSQERVCYAVSIIEGQHIKGRLTLLVANEDEGF